MCTVIHMKIPSHNVIHLYNVTCRYILRVDISGLFTHILLWHLCRPSLGILTKFLLSGGAGIYAKSLFIFLFFEETSVLISIMSVVICTVVRIE